MRDLYSKDMEEIQVAGEKGYRIAKDFMKALIPSHAKKVQRYKSENGIPLFQRYQVEKPTYGNSRFVRKASFWWINRS